MISETRASDQLKTRIRWSLSYDVPRILEIEQECFGIHAWSDDDFTRCRRLRNCIGMVIETEADDDIAGYMFYELSKSSLHLLNLAVAPEYHRRGVGRRLVDKLIGKISPPHRRTSIRVDVRESNLDAQLFFRACGFRAVGVASDVYHGPPEDAYVMLYRLLTPNS
jgi:[ribosomal protein S18]-alanine N-acetyltransferase